MNLMSSFSILQILYDFLNLKINIILFFSSKILVDLVFYFFFFSIKNLRVQSSPLGIHVSTLESVGLLSLLPSLGHVAGQ